MSQHVVVPLFLSLFLWQNGSYRRDAYLLRLCQLIWCISMLHSHLVYPAHLSHTCLTNNLGRFFDKFSAFSHVRNKHENICTNMQIVTNKKWWEWGEKKEEGEERKRFGEGNQGVLFERLQLKWPQADSGVMLRDLTPISLSFCLLRLLCLPLSPTQTSSSTWLN